jgi:hypothetical protein
MFKRPGNQSPRPQAAALRSPSKRTTVSISPVAKAGLLPKTQPPKKIVPRIVVGTDDVWGVKSYRARNIGDALAYNSDDEVVLERLFGDN